MCEGGLGSGVRSKAGRARTAGSFSTGCPQSAVEVNHTHPPHSPIHPHSLPPPSVPPALPPSLPPSLPASQLARCPPEGSGPLPLKQGRQCAAQAVTHAEGACVCVCREVQGGR